MGACDLFCAGGSTECNGKCVDVTVDPANCGACGSACGQDELCTASQCVLTCTGGLTACNGTCVNTATDAANCGACGVTCPSNKICGAGSCVFDPSTYGQTQSTPGLSCNDILQVAPGNTSGVYWIDPNGGSTADALQVYCDMLPTGGWTKLMSAKWTFLFTSANWTSLNPGTPLGDNYSILSSRASFMDMNSCFTFRLVVGNSGAWQSPPAHTTVWKQCHDPFTQTTNGSDYTYISGDISSTCGGFNGLHNKYTGHSFASDADAGDNVSCWWMQIVPHTNYNGMGYLEGYGGSFNYHQWQVLYVR
jgi:hypothetical protein